MLYEVAEIANKEAAEAALEQDLRNKAWAHLFDLINFPIVCAVLALDSLNYYSGEQGLTAQHITRLYNFLYTA